MSLRDLTPQNSARAQSTAINAFKRFLATENVDIPFIQAAIVGDTRGAAFIKLMDRFAVFLAFSGGSDGRALAKNSVMSYYRQVKNWLLDMFPQQRVAIERQLLQMGRTLERYCLKRAQGGLVTKAPACTKVDLFVLVDSLYNDAASGKEYQDAALIVLMWYSFGRASDLAVITKSSLSLCSGNVLLLKLIRQKTSEEQGLSMFPDKKSYATCPMHAVGVALAMQEMPSVSLLDQQQVVSKTPPLPVDALSNGIPLVEALMDDDIDIGNAISNNEDSHGPKNKHKKDSAMMKMHGYVNRVLKGVSARQDCGRLTAYLSSHSFRRGGAQHANSDSTLSAQWIFDRGSWNMTATSKAFAYVFNTTNEDQKVAKVLSGWKSDEKVCVPSLEAFDSVTQSRIAKFAQRIFSSSMGLCDRKKTLDSSVAIALTAVLLRYYPDISSRYPLTPYVARFRECLTASGIEQAEVCAWSTALVTRLSQDRSSIAGTLDNKEMQLINHQNRVISELIAMNREQTALIATQSERVARLERAILGSSAHHEPNAGVAKQTKDADVMQSHSSTPIDTSSTRLRAAPRSPSSLWYEWYTKQPRLWEHSTDRQHKSMCKQVVAYMKLFLADGFILDTDAEDYRDIVLRFGNLAEANMVEFSQSHGSTRKYGSGILKAIRALHRAGELDTLISAYRMRVAAGGVVDTAPDDTSNLKRYNV